MTFLQLRPSSAQFLFLQCSLSLPTQFKLVFSNQKWAMSLGVSISPALCFWSNCLYLWAIFRDPTLLCVYFTGRDTIECLAKSGWFISIFRCPLFSADLSFVFVSEREHKEKGTRLKMVSIRERSLERKEKINPRRENINFQN